MKKIDVEEARELYGNILDNSKDIEGVVGSFPVCICRGRCVCHVTTESQKLYIEEIREKYETREQNYRKAA